MSIRYLATRKFKFSFSALAVAALMACGGGGGGSPTAQLNGVAAYGAPMAGAIVTLTDANGQTRSATAGSDGSYSLDVTGLTAPFLLKASGSFGDSVKEYSALMVSAPKTGETSTANITPLTHALVTMVSSDGTSPNEFSDISKLKALDSTKLNAALGTLQAALKDVLTDAGLSNTFDPVTVSFKADRTTAADVLLDTIKVSVSDQGVSLTNARVPASDTDSNSATATVTLKGPSASTITPLPKPTVSQDDLKALDSFVKDANACLALAPTARVSKDSNGNYTFLGACDAVSGFDRANYLAYGYSLSQLWGMRLLEQIPANSKLLTPEFLLFTDNGNKAIVKLASTSPDGGRVYFETAAKSSDGSWKIIGNQRKYDASIGVRLYRQTDLSTNGWTIPSTYTNSADAGKNVGNFNAYTSRLSFGFNQSGPYGSNVYAVRVKGPGLPASGIVLSRSSACGTSDYLAFYSNNGVLPSLSVASSSMTTTSATNSWTLDVQKFGDTYKGTDFYNQYRGMTSTGLPSTSTSNNIAASAVNMKSIPDFALYKWEVFTTSGGNPDTFTSRIITRPLAASEGSKQPWASFSKDTLGYLDPSNTLSAELSDATLSWALPNSKAPAVTSAYVYGENTIAAASGSTSVRMIMGQNVSKLGDASVKLAAGLEANGNGQTCSYSKVPSFTATTGYREVGLRQSTDGGMTLQQFSFHKARSAS